MYLNQLIALVNGQKSRAASAITGIKAKLKRAELSQGLIKTYTPKNEDGQELPPERKSIQIRVDTSLEEVEEILTELFDSVISQDYTNTQTSADIKLDGATLVSGVPVSTILYLEKQLTELSDLIVNLPTLDTAEEWTYDDASNSYVSTPTDRLLTKKVFKNHVKAEATAHHPAQVDVYSEDIVIGTWTTKKFSSAIPESRRVELVKRLQVLLTALQQAREEANRAIVDHKKVGAVLLRYLFE